MTLQEAIVAQMTAYRAVKPDGRATALDLARDISGFPVGLTEAAVLRGLSSLRRKGLVKGGPVLWALCGEDL